MSSTLVSAPVNEFNNCSGKTVATEDTAYNSDMDDDASDEVESSSSGSSNSHRSNNNSSPQPVEDDDDDDDDNDIDKLEYESAEPDNGDVVQRRDSENKDLPRRGLVHRDSMIKITASGVSHKPKQINEKDGHQVMNTNKQRLTMFYKKHNPSKLRTVDVTLNKYVGKEDELQKMIVDKYGKRKTKKFELLISPAEDEAEDSDEDDDDLPDDRPSGRMMGVKDSMKLIPVSNNDNDSDDDVDNAPMSAQMAQRMKNKSHHGMTAMDSMKLIPTSFSDDLSDDDNVDTNGMSDEAARLTRSVAASYHASKSMKNLDALLAEPIPIVGRTISFGVYPEKYSMKKMKGKDFDPIPVTRQLSFDSHVRVNHIGSFKHDLTSKEQENVWYQDWEMVMMKFDCGLFGKEAENRRKERQQEVDAQRKAARGGKQTNKKTSTQQSAAAKRNSSAADDAKSKALKKKYGIDKKVKDNKKDGSKKKGLFASFSKKKK